MIIGLVLLQFIEHLKNIALYRSAGFKHRNEGVFQIFLGFFKHLFFNLRGGGNFFQGAGRRGVAGLRRCL